MSACRTRARAAFLSFNLLFIIVAYYTVKTASRSIILEDAGSEILPYVWIGSALVMLFLVPIYQWLVAHLSRFVMLLSTLVLTVAAIAAFWIGLATPTVTEAALFYGFSDVVSVVIVEQFWSLANSEFRTGQAKRWYGVIGSGGLIGGVAGGLAAAWMVGSLGLSTRDLLLVAIGFIVLIGIVTAAMIRSGTFADPVMGEPAEAAEPDPIHVARENGYLLLVAVILLLAQLVTPFIEYQFMTLVGDRFDDQDERTVYLSGIFGWISGTALAINLLLTTWVHRRFGAIGGLIVRPLAIIGGSAVFMFAPVVGMAAMLRVVDKALAYSINRASRELLYVPMAPTTVYQAKAWIDMLGFRLFKVFGSGVIILLTTGIKTPLSLSQLSLIVIGIATVWTVAILKIRGRYRAIADDVRDVTVASPVREAARA